MAILKWSISSYFSCSFNLVANSGVETVLLIKRSFETPDDLYVAIYGVCTGESVEFMDLQYFLALDKSNKDDDDCDNKEYVDKATHGIGCYETQ